QVVTFAVEQMRALAGNEEERTVLVVGARPMGRLEDAGCAVSERFPVPGTVTGITPAVNDVLLKIEELRSRKGIDHLLLIHHRPSARAGSAPSKLQLLPLDSAWLRSLAT